MVGDEGLLSCDCHRQASCGVEVFYFGANLVGMMRLSFEVACQTLSSADACDPSPCECEMRWILCRTCRD